MKAVVVLRSWDMTAQVPGINGIMADSAIHWSTIELWVVHSGPAPSKFPRLNSPPSCIRLIRITDPHLAEPMIDALKDISQQAKPDILFFGNTGLDQEIATRLSFRLDAHSSTGVSGIRLSDAGIEIIRSAYAGNLEAVFTAPLGAVCLSVAHSISGSVDLIAYANVKKTTTISQVFDRKSLSWRLSRKILNQAEDDAKEFETKSMILAAGMGAGSREGMDILDGFAADMGAALGGTRPAVMNGWLPLSRLIGVSGRVISPEICIVAGASGSGAFARGMDNSGFILAVNTDKSAPIFQLAHAGVVEDLFEFLTALVQEITMDKNDDS